MGITGRHPKNQISQFDPLPIMKFTFMIGLLSIAMLLSASKKSNIPPSIEFITELKKKNGCAENKSDHLTHCYYFGNVESWALRTFGKGFKNNSILLENF